MHLNYQKFMISVYFIYESSSDKLFNFMKIQSN